VKPEFRLSPTSLADIYVPGTGNAQIPLTSVATVSERVGALSIGHLGQFPATTVSFNLAGSHSLGQAVDAIEKAQKELNLPQSVRVNFQGAALAFRASLLNTLLLILAAIVTMYIVLGVLYESYIHPVTILSTLPSAGVGALLSLLIAGQDLGIIAIIGIILLIGIVKKNAILMVDFALDAERARWRRAMRSTRPRCCASGRSHDDYGGTLGALPSCSGRGRGAAPPARHRDGGRPHLLADAHDLHHARDLPVLRPRRASRARLAQAPRGAQRRA
jgi:multidrug efflux pump